MMSVLPNGGVIVTDVAVSDFAALDDVSATEWRTNRATW